MTRSFDRQCFRGDRRCSWHLREGIGVRGGGGLIHEERDGPKVTESTSPTHKKEVDGWSFLLRQQHGSLHRCNLGGPFLPSTIDRNKYSWQSIRSLTTGEYICRVGKHKVGIFSFFVLFLLFQKKDYIARGIGRSDYQRGIPVCQVSRKSVSRFFFLYQIGISMFWVNTKGIEFLRKS